MRVLSWNIQQGGGRRWQAIADTITRIGADVVVLTEVRPTSERLLARLAESGWTHQLTGVKANPISCAAMLSRTELVQVEARRPATILPGRWIEAKVPAFDATIAAVYGPLHRDPHDEFWAAACDEVSARVSKPFLLTGDLNTGRSLADAPRKNFFCSRHFDRLQELGLTDLWRSRNETTAEYSYHHRLKGGVRGNGFRIDHAMASPPLSRRFVSASYEHSLREERVSDHSPLVVEFT